MTQLKSKSIASGLALLLPVLGLSPAYAAGDNSNKAPYVPVACVRTTPAPSSIAEDKNLAPAVRDFLAKINKDAKPFWKLPQPQPQETLSKLQDQTQIDMSGVTTNEHSMTVDGRTVKLYVMKPDHMAAHPGVILFLHGGVWIVGDFDNHKRLLRDLVVGSGQPAVFLEYTPVPTAKYPVQMNEAYAALQWTATHAEETGGDPHRIAVVGNSVGGAMTAALTLMDKDQGGPKISYQVLLWPATDAAVNTCSYQAYAKDRFLSKDFMKYGWDIYAPTAKERQNPYVSPLRASLAELQGLPPALVITVENDVLRDEGEAYAHRLQDAGVPTVATRYNGTIHDFGLLNALAKLPTTEAAIQQVADGIRAHIGGD